MIATREQDCAVERLALSHGRVHVGESRMAGREGNRVATVPSGASFTITPEGHVRRSGQRFDIDWSY